MGKYLTYGGLAAYDAALKTYVDNTYRRHAMPVVLFDEDDVSVLADVEYARYAYFVGEATLDNEQAIIAYPWERTVVHLTGGTPFLLSLVNGSDYLNGVEWYGGEYHIRIICDGVDGQLIFPANLRWACALSQEMVENTYGFAGYDDLRIPPFRDGYTYDLRILDGVAQWTETPNQ